MATVWGVPQVGEVFNIQRVKGRYTLPSGERITQNGFIWGRTVSVRPAGERYTGMIYVDRDGTETSLQKEEVSVTGDIVEGGELPPGFTKEEADLYWPPL